MLRAKTGDLLKIIRELRKQCPGVKTKKPKAHFSSVSRRNAKMSKNNEPKKLDTQKQILNALFAQTLRKLERRPNQPGHVTPSVIPSNQARAFDPRQNSNGIKHKSKGTFTDTIELGHSLPTKSTGTQANINSRSAISFTPATSTGGSMALADQTVSRLQQMRAQVDSMIAQPQEQPVEITPKADQTTLHSVLQQATVKTKPPTQKAIEAMIIRELPPSVKPKEKPPKGKREVKALEGTPKKLGRTRGEELKFAQKQAVRTIKQNLPEEIADVILSGQEKTKTQQLQKKLLPSKRSGIKGERSLEEAGELVGKVSRGEMSLERAFAKSPKKSEEAKDPRETREEPLPKDLFDPSKFAQGKKPSDSKVALSDRQLNEYMARKVGNRYKGTISRDQIPFVKLNKGVPSSFIFNTATSDQPGEHWCACYVDPKKRHLCYYDSFGEEPQTDVSQMLTNLVHPLRKMRFQYKINRIKEQHATSHHCGHHCARFLTKMHSGGKFKDVTPFKSQEKEAKKSAKEFAQV